MVHVIQESRWNDVGGNSMYCENYFWDGKLNPPIEYFFLVKLAGQLFCRAGISVFSKWVQGKCVGPWDPFGECKKIFL